MWKNRRREKQLMKHKAELYVRLHGLYGEMAEWDSLIKQRIKATWTGRSPQEVSRQIGCAVAERNLVELELKELG